MNVAVWGMKVGLVIITLAVIFSLIIAVTPTQLSTAQSDLFDYYRAYSGDSNTVDTFDLLKAADDWIAGVVPLGFSQPITTMQLLALADGWIVSTPIPTLTPTLTPSPTSTPTRQMKIGDYVQFGRYDNEPILWRVIEDSANPNANVGDVITGDPLLFSDKIICEKPFDAAGPHGISGDRLDHGSNLWQTSNMRSWLNSSAKAGSVTWLCGNPPTKDGVEDNDYAGEKGFLAVSNFAVYERNLIKSVTQKSLLYYVDRGMAEGGSVAYRYKDEIDKIVNNYDSAWYHNVTDRVFLLDPKQVNGVYNRFGRFYYNNRDDYWLRAPDTNVYTDSSSANVLYIRGRDGVVMYRRANYDLGVRPALTLDLKSVIFESGDGSDVNPYVITGQ